MAVATGKIVKLSPKDNVVVALSELAPQSVIADTEFRCQDKIPAGHKVAISQINSGEAVVKYGQIIGFASKDILPGMHVHTHNIELQDFTRDYAIGTDARPVSLLPDT